MNREWDSKTFARDKNAAKRWLVQQTTIPTVVAGAVTALIDALPEKRDDLSIMVHVSGLLGDWSDYKKPPPGVPPMPKPQGFFNLWVSYSNQPPLV